MASSNNNASNIDTNNSSNNNNNLDDDYQLRSDQNLDQMNGTTEVLMGVLGEGGRKERESDTSSGTENDDDDVVVVDNAEKPKYQLEGATLVDVEVSQSEINCIYNNKNKANLKTKLVSIKGTPVADLLAKDLIIFARVVHIPGARKQKKDKLCEMILDAKDLYDKSDRNDGVLEAEKKIGKDTKRAVKINIFRMMNVVCDSAPLIDERAAALSKNDLDEGVKTGQKFYTQLIEKYNSKDDKYDSNMFPHDVSGIKDPSDFDQLTKGDWRILRETFDATIRSYEKVYRAHFKYGTHSNIPFNRFTNSTILVYIHLIMENNHGLLDKAAGFLPDFAFRESCNPKGSNTGDSKIPRKSPSAAALKSNYEKERFNDNMEIKNQNFQFAIFNASHSQIRNDLRLLKRERKEAFKEIVDREGIQCKKKAKDMYLEFHNKKKNELNYESDDSEMREVYKLDEEIEDEEKKLYRLREQLADLERKMQLKNETLCES